MDNLFSAFPPITNEQWKARATEDLKGADFDKKLVWQTYEGFRVQPFYTREDLKGLDLPVTPKVPNTTWINYQKIEETDAKQANAKALHALRFDCHGLLFHVNPQTDFQVLLQDIDPAKTHISFHGDQMDEAIISYFEYLNKINVPLSQINGFCDFDLLGRWITTDADLSFDSLVRLINLTKDAPHFYGLHIHSGDFINAGANFTQELAFTLCKMVDYIDQLTEKGVKPADVIANISFDMAITGDFFFEVAKLRAFRNLLAGVLGTYGKESVHPPILSSSSIWSKSRYDHYVNMLRNTTEAMSAVIGGCDALLINPHDSTYEAPTDFSHRIAVNISNLLKEESYFDKVQDPAAGSYYIETLTQNLFDHALELFHTTEKAGGFIKSAEKGLIQQQIGEIRKQKIKDISTRKMVIVGTNKYPNPDEKTDFQLPSLQGNASDGRELLVAQRASRPVDELRQRTHEVEMETGHIPRIYLASFGNLTMRKARASFASEFFSVAGFSIMGEYFEDNIAENARKSAQSEADIVVICSSDQDYVSHAVPFAQKFRALNQDKKLVLAGYPTDLAEELKAAGVDAFIHLKTDAIETLTYFQDQLLKTVKSGIL